MDTQLETIRDNAENSIQARRHMAVKSAILNSWDENGTVPFPLYDYEADHMATAAIAAYEVINR